MPKKIRGFQGDLQERLKNWKFKGVLQKSLNISHQKERPAKMLENFCGVTRKRLKTHVIFTKNTLKGLMFK